MQGNMRRVAAKWFTVALFALLIASFALWGVGDIFRGGGPRGPVVQVGDTRIDANTFARSYRRQVRQVQQQFGGRLTPDMMRELGLGERIVRQIATRALFTEAARDLGLAISQEQLVNQITEQSAFRDSQGQFVRARFETALQRAGLTEGQYLDLLTTDIQRDLLVEAVTAGATVPGPLAEELYKYRNERRRADYAVIADSAFTPEAPSEAELRDYYADHDQPFMAPPYRAITFLHLTPDQLLDEVKVSESVLRDAYERRRDDFHTPARRQLRQVVFDDAATAKKARSRLDAGASLAEVAEAFTDGGVADLGTVTRADLFSDALAEAAFSASEGAVTAPVETALGWHLVKVEKVNPAQTRPFEAVEDELRRDLARDKAVDALVSLTNQIDDTLAGGASLERAADSLGLRLRTVPALDRDGNGRDGEPVPDLPQSPEFLARAFETAEGERTLLTETDAGGYFILRVDETIPARKRPFEDVRAAARAAYLADQRRAAARAAADTLESAVSASTSFAQAADSRDLSIQSTPPLRREGNTDADAVAQALAGPLFDAEESGDLVRAEIDRGVVVARLTEVAVPAPAENPEALAGTCDGLRQALSRDLLLQFVDSLRSTYEVRINQAQVDRIVNQIQ